MMLLPLLVLISEVLGDDIHPVTVTRFEHTPNLHLDPIGPRRLYYKQWKIIVYIDLREVRQSELQITQALHHPLLTKAGPLTMSVLNHILSIDLSVV